MIHYGIPLDPAGRSRAGYPDWPRNLAAAGGVVPRFLGQEAGKAE
jgi:hypothetical protein